MYTRFPKIFSAADSSPWVEGAWSTLITCLFPRWVTQGQTVCVYLEDSPNLVPILCHFHLACIMPHCGRYHHNSVMRFMAQKTRMISLPCGEKVWWQVWPFGHNISMWHTETGKDGFIINQVSVTLMYIQKHKAVFLYCSNFRKQLKSQIQ